LAFRQSLGSWPAYLGEYLWPIPHSARLVGSHRDGFECMWAMATNKHKHEQFEQLPKNLPTVCCLLTAQQQEQQKSNKPNKPAKMTLSDPKRQPSL